MKEHCYPFSAIVGQSAMKTALKAVAVDPVIGGVLVKGPRGTGKSTLARSLVELLPEQHYRPDCPLRCDPANDSEGCPFCETESPDSLDAERPRFVEVPLGATPDQLIGSLSIEEAVNEGKTRLNPGLLARAHRGVLYVDEVNLLPDRLVDLLLDVAASGINRVERDGLSVEHSSEFLLIGTMNPEEGRLRPQLRDRFGLSVHASEQTDPERRQELARRASAFKSDPGTFRQKWSDEQQNLRTTIRNARERLPEVSFNDGQPEWIAQRVLDSGAEGHRADIVVRRTARALAALRDRKDVHQQDLEDAFELAIEHRRSPDPNGGGRPPEPDPNHDPFDENGESDGAGTDGESVIEPRESEHLSLTSDSVDTPDSTSGTKLKQEPIPAFGKRFNPAATLRRSQVRSLRDKVSGAIKPEDLVFDTLEEETPSLLLWVLDASASMARNETIGFVKSVVKNYMRTWCNNWTGLVDFRGDRGSTVVAPTRRHERVLSELDELPVGGETPFVEGLRSARSVLDNFQSRHHGASARVVLVSDGRFQLTESIHDAVRMIQREAELSLVDAELDSTGWGVIPTLARHVGVQPISLRRAVA